MYCDSSDMILHWRLKTVWFMRLFSAAMASKCDQDSSLRIAERETNSTSRDLNMQFARLKSMEQYTLPWQVQNRLRKRICLNEEWRFQFRWQPLISRTSSHPFLRLRAFETPAGEKCPRDRRYWAASRECAWPCAGLDTQSRTTARGERTVSCFQYCSRQQLQAGRQHDQVSEIDRGKRRPLNRRINLDTLPWLA